MFLIKIVSVSKEIIKELSIILKRLNINHTFYIGRSRKSTEKDSYLINVRGIERIEKWIDKRGFNNPAQCSKYLVWKKFEFCPPKSTIEQRQFILSDKLDPCSFYKNAPDRI